MVVFIWTGIGEGKSTSALGAALRTVAHDKKAVIIQFMKGKKDTGEFLIKDKLAPFYEIFQFGSENFVNLKNPSDEDKKMANDALVFAREKIKDHPHLLVLDEVNIACSYGLIDTSDVLDFIKNCPNEINLFLTGRFCPREIMDIADYVTEFICIKQPNKMTARKGIEY